MAIINSPPKTAIDTMDKSGVLTPPSEGWRNFFNAVFNICNASTMSGTTAQRPAVLLWPGRPYFDKSLGTNGKKIFCDKNAAGVWVDSSGNIV